MSKKLSNTKLQRFITNSESMRSDPDFPLFEAGVTHGESEMKKKVLTYLEKQYLSPEAPSRMDPKAEAILALARELAQNI